MNFIILRKTYTRLYNAFNGNSINGKTKYCEYFSYYKTVQWQSDECANSVQWQQQ